MALGTVNRFPAEVVGDMTKCCICANFTRSIHWHHTIPQATGGTESLQIPLCGDCHTQLHSKASAIVAKIHGNRKTKIGAYWANPMHEGFAEPWLQILVNAILVPPAGEDKMVLLPSQRVKLDLRYGLEILKRDLGNISVANAIMFCIKFTLHSKGIKYEQHDKSNNQKQTNLW
jgi:hypothetical protein